MTRSANKFERFETPSPENKPPFTQNDEVEFRGPPPAEEVWKDAYRVKWCKYLWGRWIVGAQDVQTGEFIATLADKLEISVMASRLWGEDEDVPREFWPDEDLKKEEEKIIELSGTELNNFLSYIPIPISLSKLKTAYEEELDIANKRGTIIVKTLPGRLNVILRKGFELAEITEVDRTNDLVFIRRLGSEDF